jgi:p-cumate 2,3-dioxygenase ferredoxin subunit
MSFRLCATKDIAPGAIGSGLLPDGTKVAIYNVDGVFYVTDDVCTHGQASLSEEGSLDGCLVECGWHFGAFDVTTGQPAASPCTEPLRTYPVAVEGGDIFIELTEPS